VACVFATIGEVEEAIVFLARAALHGTVNAAWMRNDPDLAALRGDARFQALLRQLEEKGAATGA